MAVPLRIEYPSALYHVTSRGNGRASIESKATAEALQQYAERNADPKCAMADAYLTGGYTLAEIARHFGVHYTTVSRVVRTQEKTR